MRSVPTVVVLDGTGGPALTTVRSLGRAGWRVLVPSGSRCAASRYASAALPLPDLSADPRGFRDALASVLERERVDVLVPTSDAAVELAWGLGDRRRGARIMGVLDESLGAVLLDKARAARATQRVGFPVPPWYEPTDSDEAVRRAADLGFPCVVKPRKSTLAHDGRLLQVRHRVVSTPQETAQAFACNAAADPPIVQAFVPGRALSVGAVIHRARLLAYAARETLSFYPIAGGTSVWKRTVGPREPGVQEAIAMLLALGYEGLGEVEYQVNEGVPQFMEVGVRPFGWLSLAVAAGVDLPLIAARAMMGQAPERVPRYIPGIEMRWPGGEVRRMVDAVLPRTRLPAGTSRTAVLRRTWPPWRPGMRYDGIARDDPRPMLPGRVRAATWSLNGRSR